MKWKIKKWKKDVTVIMKKKLERKPKALALLSGGLDSLLAVKLILEQKIEVEN